MIGEFDPEPVKPPVVEVAVQVLIDTPFPDGSGNVMETEDQGDMNNVAVGDAGVEGVPAAVMEREEMDGVP